MTHDAGHPQPKPLPLTEEDDRTLAARVASGERAAFEQLMRRYNRRLYRLARVTLRDDAEAEDALQEAYLAAFRAIPRFRGDASLSTWLSRFVLNECLTRQRRGARRDTIAPMVVGELDGSERPRTRLLARCLQAVGDVRLTRNVRGQIWSKLLVNSAFTGLSAVSGLRYGGVAQHPDGRAAVYAIWAEGFAVAWAEEVTLDRVLEVEPRELIDRDDAALARMMTIAGNTKPSMLQDLEQGRPTEVDVVNGGVAQRARAHRIATPFNDRVVELVHAMERGERAPAPRELTELVAVASSDGDRPV